MMRRSTERMSPDVASGGLASVCERDLAEGVAVKVKDLIALLEAHGWYHARTAGSHRQFRHHDSPGTVTVSGKLSVDIPPGTLKSALKQAGLAKNAR